MKPPVIHKHDRYHYLQCWKGHNCLQHLKGPNRFSGYRGDTSIWLKSLFIYNVQRTVTAKVGKQGLWSLYFTCCLMVVNISVVWWKYPWQTVFKLPSEHEYTTEITIYTIQRAITPKIGKPQLWFFFSAHHLMVLNISVKFHDNISGCFSSYKSDTSIWPKSLLPCSKCRHSKSRKTSYGSCFLHVLLWWYIFQ